jgi:PAS domain S-box-containing protein
MEVFLNEGVWLWGGGTGLITLSNVPTMASAILLEVLLFVLLARGVARLHDLSCEVARSEERLRNSQSNYFALIELAPEGVAVVQKGNIAYCNEHLLEMFGYPLKEILGAPFQGMLRPDERERAVTTYMRRMAGEQISPEECRYVTRGGELRWMKYVGKRIDWQGSPAAMYLVSDITEKKSLEQQCRQAQRMEAVGRLAGGVAHDFNNILQVVLGASEAMIDQMDCRERLLSSIGTVRDAVTDAASLTGQLLAFSRKQPARMATLDLAELLRRCERMLKVALGKERALHLLTDKKASTICADEG